MEDFEKLMVAIYEDTIAKDALFARHDALVQKLGIDQQTFSHLHSVLDQKRYLGRGVAGMVCLSHSGIEYVERYLR